MNPADICFLIFIVLLTVIGMFKGFVRMIVDLFSGIIAFVAAVVLSGPIASALGGMSLFDSSKEKIRTFFLDHAANASETVGKAVAKLQIPEFIKSFILKDAGDPAALIGSGVDTLADKVFMMMLTAVIFIVIMVIIRIVFFILEKSIEGIFKKVKLLNATNKILGGALGFVNAIFTVYIILAILAMTSSTFPQTVSYITESILVSRLYFNNLLLQLLT
ncbi:MAG: CvpA family protein [Saccharofermentanales bacterium]